MSGEHAGARREPVHGFALNPQDERLLRGPVPPRALRWAASAVGDAARLLASRPLAGGTSSAVHALTVKDGNGRALELVLRRFVREEWLAEEPDVAEREAAALTLIAGHGLPTPALLAVDPDGAAAGVPAVLMSRLPGRIEWDPPDVDAFLRRLVEPLPSIHATPVPPRTPLPPYASYPVELRRPPAWASQPEVWLRAIERLDGPPPSEERLLIHRDYHPGNVLWHEGRVSGLIDWVNTSVGCPWADIGHCRMNLASELGPRAADRLLELFRAASGRTDEYDPYWDIAAAVGGLDEDVDEAPSPADERFLGAAVARL